MQTFMSGLLGVTIYALYLFAGALIFWWGARLVVWFFSGGDVPSPWPF